QEQCAGGRRHPPLHARATRFRIASNSTQGLVFATSAAVSHARRAVAIPYRGTRVNVAGRWASVEITSGTPAAAAARAWMSFRSRRSGLAFISSMVAVLTAASITLSTSYSYGDRC